MFGPDFDFPEFGRSIVSNLASNFIWVIGIAIFSSVTSFFTWILARRKKIQDFEKEIRDLKSSLENQKAEVKRLQSQVITLETENRKINNTLSLSGQQFRYFGGALVTSRLTHTLRETIGGKLISQDDCRLYVKALLLDVCLSIAPEVSIHDKAATFLTVDHTVQYFPFRLYEQVGHVDVNKLRNSIRTKLQIDNSLAGQAFLEKSCIVLPDSLEVPSYIRWTHFDYQGTSGDFRSHAAVAVQPITTTVVGDAIGVLCLDIRPAWVIRDYEKNMLNQLADKLAEYWMLAH